MSGCEVETAEGAAVSIETRAILKKHEKAHKKTHQKIEQIEKDVLKMKTIVERIEPFLQSINKKLDTYTATLHEQQLAFDPVQLDTIAKQQHEIEITMKAIQLLMTNSSSKSCDEKEELIPITDTDCNDEYEFYSIDYSCSDQLHGRPSSTSFSIIEDTASLFTCDVTEIQQKNDDGSV